MLRIAALEPRGGMLALTERRLGKGTPGSDGLACFLLGDLKTVLLRYLVPRAISCPSYWWETFLSGAGVLQKCSEIFNRDKSSPLRFL